MVKVPGNTRAFNRIETSCTDREYKDPRQEVSRGLVAGRLNLPMYGHIDSVDATGWSSITSAFQIAPPASPFQVELLSSDPGDTNQVLVMGLATGFNGVYGESDGLSPWQFETVTLTGTSAAQAASPLTFSDFFMAQTVNGDHAGDITIRIAGGATLGVIPAGFGVSPCDRLTIPDGWQGVLNSFQPFWGGDQWARWRIRCHREGRFWSPRDGMVVASNSGNRIELCGGIVLEQETTVVFEGIRGAGVGSFMQVNASLELIRVTDEPITTGPGFP